MKYASQIPRETIARLEAMAAEDPVRFCQPHPCPGVYSSREEEEFWCYKCWGHALEQPMPGSNLAEFFRQQDLQFPLPAGFREERRQISLCRTGEDRLWLKNHRCVEQKKRGFSKFFDGAGCISNFFWT